MSMPLKVSKCAIQNTTNLDLESFVRGHGIGVPVMLKFGAVWCRPCKNIEPLYDTLAQQYGSSIAFYTIDILEWDEFCGDPKHELGPIPDFRCYVASSEDEISSVKMVAHFIGADEKQLKDTVTAIHSNFCTTAPVAENNNNPRDHRLDMAISVLNDLRGRIANISSTMEKLEHVLMG